MCQECLEKLQSAYEFKFRCEENRNFLINYLKDCADTKKQEERATKDAALAALDIDIDNLDALPDKLVLKNLKKEKKPRKPRDPAKPRNVRRRRIPEKNVIIAENSQVESTAYVRKMVTTPEASPDQKHASKRKSKHVVIEDIFVGEKGTKVKKEKEKEKILQVKDSDTKESTKENDGVVNESPAEELTVEVKKKPRADDEPIFEDDDDFEEPEKKRSKRSKK